MKRIFVDMSATLLHHGHVRLLQKAKSLGGHVVVALTTDDEVLRCKGYLPELSFEQRKELLQALKYVDEVIACPWLITEQFLIDNHADVFVHSGVNNNATGAIEVIEFERTEGISSSEMRERCVHSIITKRNSDRILLTPGPTNLHCESLYDLVPAFSRNDSHYAAIEAKVSRAILDVTGQDTLAVLQGSATTAIEVATSNFLSGDVCVVLTGFYSQRILDMLQLKHERLGLASVRGVAYDDLISEPGTVSGASWIIFVSVETADAFLCDIPRIKSIAAAAGAKLMMDATGSINLEDNHELADVCLFSSCKGLGGFTGAGFISFNQTLPLARRAKPNEFILDIETYLNHKTTAPVHAMSSLYSISTRFRELRNRVERSKQAFMELAQGHLFRPDQQPNLCTKVKGVRYSGGDNVLMYHPRAIEPECQVVCHLFDQFPSNREPGEFYQELSVVPLQEKV